jgi:DNA-binding MarR family transcriptional regulator
MKAPASPTAASPRLPTPAMHDTAVDASQVTLGMLLSMVKAEMVRALEAEFASKNVDLSFTQYLILKKSQQLGPVSATELARAVEIDGGAMTRQLDHLERKGYLRRTPHEQDRRALRIELTEAGSAIGRRPALQQSRDRRGAALADRKRARAAARLSRTRAAGPTRRALIALRTAPLPLPHLVPPQRFRHHFLDFDPCVCIFSPQRLP